MTVCYIYTTDALCVLRFENNTCVLWLLIFLNFSKTVVCLELCFGMRYSIKVAAKYSETKLCCQICIIILFWRSVSVVTGAKKINAIASDVQQKTCVGHVELSLDFLFLSSLTFSHLLSFRCSWIALECNCRYYWSGMLVKVVINKSFFFYHPYLHGMCVFPVLGYCSWEENRFEKESIYHVSPPPLPKKFPFDYFDTFQRKLLQFAAAIWLCVQFVFLFFFQPIFMYLKFRISFHHFVVLYITVESQWPCLCHTHAKYAHMFLLLLLKFGLGGNLCLIWTKNTLNVVVYHVVYEINQKY